MKDKENQEIQEKPKEKRSGLPVWAKLIIGLVILSFVGFITLAITLAYVGQRVYQDSQDPVKMQKVAAEIANFGPLPDGYKYGMGFGLGGYDALTVEHAGVEQMLMIASYPEKKESDPKLFTKKIFETNLHGSGADSTKTGEMTLGGQVMAYVVGEMSDQTGNKFQGMIGSVIVKEKNKAILFYGMQPPGKPYDMSVTEGFLKTIKSF